MYIYNQLLALRRYQPLVLARRMENEAAFPWEPVFASGLSLSRDARLAAELAHKVRIFTPWERRYFFGVARALDIRLIHAHHGQDGRYALSLVRRLGLPLITAFYGWDASRLPRAFGGLGRLYLRPLFREAGIILALSDYMAGELAILGCPRAKIRVHRVGVQVEKTDCVPRVSPSPGEPVRLVSAGRFIEKKGFTVLIRAFAEAQKQEPDIELTLIGDGPLRPHLEALITKLGLGGSVLMTGFLPHAEVQALFGRSHLLVQASLTDASGDKEGIPGVLMEGMASGLPAISTIHAGIPELVQDGISGRLVPEGDSDALARAIVDVVRTPDQWPQWGGQGRGQVERLHNVELQARRLEDMYDELLVAESRIRHDRSADGHQLSPRLPNGGRTRFADIPQEKD
jgi:colanic acid/amylovoran biosynthesis glycosyltransferase